MPAPSDRSEASGKGSIPVAVDTVVMAALSGRPPGASVGRGLEVVEARDERCGGEVRGDHEAVARPHALGDGQSTLCLEHEEEGASRRQPDRERRLAQQTTM